MCMMAWQTKGWFGVELQKCSEDRIELKRVRKWSKIR